jgi:hypothetical protein
MIIFNYWKMSAKEMQARIAKQEFAQQQGSPDETQYVRDRSMEGIEKGMDYFDKYAVTCIII